MNLPARAQRVLAISEQLGFVPGTRMPYVIAVFRWSKHLHHLMSAFDLQIKSNLICK